MTAPSSSSQPLLYSPAPGGGLRGGLQSFSRVLSRHWLLVLGAVALAMGLGAAYVLLTPDVYQAESLLLTASGEPEDPDDALTLGFVAGPTDATTDELLLMLRESPALAQTVAARLLRDSASGAPASGDPTSGARGPEAEETRRALAERLRATVAFSAREPTAIAISATSPSAPEAARIANAYAEAAIEYVREDSKRRLAESRAFVAGRLATAESELEETEEALASYMSREGTAALDTEAQAVVNDGARLSSSVREASAALQARRASVQATEAELRRIRPGLAPQVGSGADREIEAAQTQMAALETRLEQFYQTTPDARATPDDPRTRQLRSEIAQWKRRIDELSDRYVRESLATGGAGASGAGVGYATDLERRLIEDRIAITGLEAQLAAQRGQLGTYAARRQDIPRQSVAVVQLERRRATAEQLYTYLSSKLQEITIAENSEIGSLRMLREADPPAEVLNKSPLRVMGLGGPARAAARLRRSRHALSRGRARAHARGRSGNGHRASGHRPVDGRGAPPQKGIWRTQRTPVGGPADNVVALLTPQSEAAEAYRHLYSRIQFGLPDRVAQVILVTSAEVGAGKSTTAVNLAATMVRANRRTLLIDADLRRPSVARYLGVEEGPSLQSLIEHAGTMDEVESLAEASFTPTWNLFALSTRTPVAVPMDVLTSPRMRVLLPALRARFDSIVIDTPPMMVASDAALIASLCDACLLVAQAGTTDTEALAQSRSELEEAGGHVLGAVLNRFDPTEARYRSTYGYRQNHYAAYHTPEPS